MDQIDLLSGLKPETELYRIRRERPDFVDGAEACRRSVLSPDDEAGLGHELRVALAARMARSIGCDELARTYDGVLAGASGNSVMTKIAAAEAVPQTGDAFLAAVVHHADLVTLTPRDSTRGDIENLAAAGLSNPQIVALSELIAFVNFEARIVTGLSVLELVE